MISPLNTHIQSRMETESKGTNKIFSGLACAPWLNSVGHKDKKKEVLKQHVKQSHSNFIKIIPTSFYYKLFSHKPSFTL